MPNYRLEKSSRVLLISTRQKKKISNRSNEITTLCKPPSRFPLDLRFELGTMLVRSMALRILTW